ncbi:MAG TPA: sugar-binding protein [Phycisphaerae bacterium]|nr:sugar-binding protein [Phycisphaerae bacterium]HNU44148.1 sugar-binding protein [Phycisphaerae bacterium]
MTRLVPNRFLFDFEFPLRYCPAPPPIDGDVCKWTDEQRVPALGVLDGQPAFADIWVCWHESGLYLACRVTDKRKRLRCEPRSPASGDGLQVCTDMRDARNVKRATRHCQQFYFLPAGGGKTGREPLAGTVKFALAREDAPPVAAQRLVVAARLQTGGYSLEAHIPADCLNGFDPHEHPRIGFHYMLADDDHGQQYLTVGNDLNWAVDPSTWAAAVLTR